ncbi:MAG: shikimate dehydrogenase [Armatimonadia bacterium]
MTCKGIDGETRVVGVIGWPVRHSLSPPMHNAAFEVLGLNWVYVPFAVAPDQVAATVQAVRALDLVGLNVTIPHKLAVLPLLDEVSAEARALGAVNTIINDEGTLRGRNTDGEGFLRSLREIGGDVSGRRVALIGAGGSARAVALAAAKAHVEQLTIINRTLEKAEVVAEMVRAAQPGAPVEVLGLEAKEAERAVREAQVVIDSTAVGMYPHHETAPVIPVEWLHREQTVCDLTYNPRETVLLSAAKAVGARTLDGTGMLVHQGALALEYWTGKKAPVEVMREALLAGLAKRSAG